MAAVLSISLWVALVTVVPGLVTIATLFGALAVVGSGFSLPGQLGEAGVWVWGAVAVAIMVATQAFGILLEEQVLVARGWLGPRERSRTLEPGIDPYGEIELSIKPYEEYKGVYVLLAELRDDEDAQGHLQRAAAQFFLTCNTLVSYSLGILAAALLALATPSPPVLLRAGGYAALLLVLLVVSFLVARSRFALMAWSLWATRRRRVRTMATVA